MKRCPTCNRTYSDETITFCLADGSLLSAPYDSSREAAPPTENLPAVTRSAVPPTQPPKAEIPTIARLPIHPGLAAKKDDGARTVSNSHSLTWIVFAFVAVTIVVGIFFALRHSLGSRNGPEAASSSQEILTMANNRPGTGASPNANISTNPTGTIPPNRSSPIENKKANTLTEDPVLFPNSKASRQAATPTASPAVDYSRIFSGRDVEQQVRITSKPEPVYTEEARRNQITGVVVLRAVFSSAGTVTNIHAVSGLPDGLTERAAAAASQIRFIPAMKDGHPVSMWMELRYNFNLY